MATTQMLGWAGVAFRGDSLSLRKWFRASGGREALHLPVAYAGYVAVSALDAICTGLILLLGGMEANPIAAAVLTHHGFRGMMLFKFALVTFVIVLCEQIVRHRPKAARSVMQLAVAATAVPVGIALVEFYFYATV